ncbi:uncharacterized protein LOC113302309 [Papaver somniferum]|uniref:uncharacterized protein LOC113302309 n=1 Tax=Papaver somniferum TaxID=3469 RepID=UPI000E6FE49E|nr:uncharacterized protein LOC113302309 [Papaver somniferum]XP_026407001.1 uncharacterized protein LOC113302309 [Papaver somniferum]XP_026407002.1 uncharacterized protein LOC113302309 [Papaver somniferum]XP_026407003.1 uncharacterized protein LOC113302309 [Papaver somniferum]XP_026407004.1 uncharacterized protein LOC113302309 [Papaver somniferum]
MVRLVDYETSSEEDDDLMIYDHSKKKRPRSPSPDSVIELGLPGPKRMINRHGNFGEEVRFQDGGDFSLESGGVKDVGGLEGGAVDLVYDPIKKNFRKRPSVSPVQTSGGVKDVGGLEGGAVDLVYDPIKKTFRKRPSVSPVKTRGFSITSNNEYGGARDEEGGAGDEHGGDAKDIRLLVNRVIPSGFHFFPSDAELVQFLTVKIEDPSFQFLCIPDIEVYKLHPEEICQGSIKICFTKVERQGVEIRRGLPGMQENLAIGY